MLFDFVIEILVLVFVKQVLNLLFLKDLLLGVEDFEVVLIQYLVNFFNFVFI